MEAWANFGMSVAIVAGVAVVCAMIVWVVDIAQAWESGWKARSDEARSKAAHAASNEEHFRACLELQSKRADREAREAVLMTQAYSRADAELKQMTARKDAAVAEARRWKALAMKARRR